MYQKWSPIWRFILGFSFPVYLPLMHYSCDMQSLYILRVYAVAKCHCTCRQCPCDSSTSSRLSIFFGFLSSLDLCLLWNHAGFLLGLFFGSPLFLFGAFPPWALFFLSFFISDCRDNIFCHLHPGLSRNLSVLGSCTYLSPSSSGHQV